MIPNWHGRSYWKLGFRGAVDQWLYDWKYWWRHRKPVPEPNIIQVLMHDEDFE